MDDLDKTIILSQIQTISDYKYCIYNNGTSILGHLHLEPSPKLAQTTGRTKRGRTSPIGRSAGMVPPVGKKKQLHFSREIPGINGQFRDLN